MATAAASHVSRERRGVPKSREMSCSPALCRRACWALSGYVVRGTSTKPYRGRWRKHSIDRTSQGRSETHSVTSRARHRSLGALSGPTTRREHVVTAARRKVAQQPPPPPPPPLWPPPWPPQPWPPQPCALIALSVEGDTIGATNQQRYPRQTPQPALTQARISQKVTFPNKWRLKSTKLQGEKRQLEHARCNRQLNWGSSS